MDTRVEVVTPDMAHNWLSANPNNRKLRKSYIRVLAGAMERGEWELNGESIKFNKKGELLDGQHRLNAVIQSMVPIQTVIVRGLGDVFGSIDTGSRRTSSDILGIKGVRSSALMAATCKLVYQAINNNYRLRPTNKEIIHILDIFPKIQDSVDFVKKYQHYKGISQSTMAFFHYVGSRMSKSKQTEIEEFLEKVFTGENCAKGDPALTLRNRLMRSASDGGARSDETKAWVWKALIAYLNGSRITRIKVASEEGLPSMDIMLDIMDDAGRA